MDAPYLNERAAKIAAAHLVEIGNEVVAGRHLLIDAYEVSNRRMLLDPVFIEKRLRMAAEVSGATVLAVNLHPFDDGGIAGVLILAESHISIHTWPELGYAALDIFMCGKADPNRARKVIDEACEGILDVEEVLRGKHLGRYL